LQGEGKTEGLESFVNAKSKSATSKALNGSSSNGMWITLAAIAGIIVIAVAAVVVAVQNNWGPFNKEPVSMDFAATTDPQISIADDGAVTVGEKDAPKLDVWEDFMCPACGQMEMNFGKDLTQAITDGKLQVTHHYVNFLDRSSAKGDFSTRMIAAAQCVAVSESLDTYLTTREKWFANQPPEGGGDRTQKDIATDAKDSGASDTSTQCIEGIGQGGNNLDLATETASNSQKALQDSGQQMATPTVLKDGQPVNIQDPKWIADAIAK